MCGIVGIFNMTNAQDAVFSEKDKSFLIKYLLSELLIETESRGKDATGYFSLFQDKNAVGLKHGIRASAFCTKDWDNGEFTFKNHLKLIEAYHNEVSPLATGLAHCRAKTIGTETDNDNNHPIFVGDFAGIHNGCLSNHIKIYSNIKDEIERIGAVDSEMIVQLVWLGTEKGEKKLDTGLIKYVTEKLEGSFAFICIDKKDPNSVMFMRDTRPIEFIYIRKAGLLIALSDKKFFENVVEKYNWFKHYGIDTPEIEYEEYTFPDDRGSILKLDTEITPETKIADFIGDVVTIEKTNSDWTETSYYTGRNSGYYNKKKYGCYGIPANEDSENLPACYKKPDKITINGSDKNSNKDVTENAVKTGKVVSIKKVLPTTEEASGEVTPKNEQIRTIVWNPAKKEFDADTKDKTDMYKEFDQNSSRKYTVFTSTKSLASRIGVEDFTLNTLTACQIANRVSKMVYEEHVEKLAEEVRTLKENEDQLENKGAKARQHIVRLRSIINAVVRMLNKSYEPGQDTLTGQEIECMGYLWKFLYSTRKTELEKTKLGLFIQSLARKNHKKKEDIITGIEKN
jgi:glucosamine 6-phosphate synthetase-like amidotransferase/phosphosugar isomerase protein